MTVFPRPIHPVPGWYREAVSVVASYAGHALLWHEGMFMKTDTVEWFRIVKGDGGGFCFAPAFLNGAAPSSAAGVIGRAERSDAAEPGAPAPVSDAPAGPFRPVEEDAPISRQGGSGNTGPQPPR